MNSIQSPVPRDPAFDNTLALKREGYRFVGNRCDRYGTDGFETRLLLRNVLCLRGEEAARLVYGEGLFTRKGAMPPTTLRLLQDKGSVQSLDGAAHRHRKAMFVRLLMENSPHDLVASFERHWQAALPEWQSKGEVELFGAVNLVLTRASAEWVGVPKGAIADDDLCRRLVDMVEEAGHVGPGMWGTLLRRATLERRVRRWVEDARKGELGAGDTPFQGIAAHRDETGELLSPAAAAVEVINLLRPIVAIGRYIVFAAMALHDHPEWRKRFAGGDDSAVEPFVEEVRRLYPFFPAIGGVALRPFTWGGKPYKKGQWVLLDIYGTNHDARLFPAPKSFDPERKVSWKDQDFRFVPHGAGDARTDHRCPGESVTVAIMAAAVRWLTQKMTYDVPRQDLKLSLHRLPALPPSGFRMGTIKAIGGR